METKICVYCKIDKNIIEFHKNKAKKDGLQDVCKECRKINADKNKEKISEYKKNWYQSNPDKLKHLSNKRYHNNKEIINKKRREVYNLDLEVKNKIKSRNKNYYEKNKSDFIEMAKKWRHNNPEKSKEISKKHYNQYKTLMICRRLIKRTIKYFGTKKEEKTLELLGYTPLELKENIESKFLDGMNWGNYGEWHIDHIKPISSFDKNEEPKVVNSLNNLQPLWAKDNLSKGSKFNNPPC